MSINELKNLTSLLTAIVTVLGLFLILFRIWFDRRQKLDEFLIQTLPLYGGKTQKRNVAIAVTEGYLQKSKRFRSIITPLLINQAIYLLFQKPIKLKSEGRKFAAHEVQNIHKIMKLLEKLTKENALSPREKDYRQIHSQYERLKKDKTLETYTIHENQ